MLSEMQPEKDAVAVGSAMDFKKGYAAIHEFGGTISRKDTVSDYNWDTQKWKRARKGGTIKIPARPYLRPAFVESEPAAVRAFVDAAKAVLQ